MIETISRDQLRDEIRSELPPVVIEVLEPGAFEEGHIPGAVNVPLSDSFERQVAKVVDKHDQRVVVYCASESCPASEKAARILSQAGYTNVVDYAGGKDDWRSAGLPLD